MRVFLTTSLRYILWLSFATIALSCKAKKVLAEGSTDKNLSAKSIIKNHYQNQLDFKSISGKMKIDYSDGESSQGVSVSLRMEKDKAIWISAPFGMVKAYITPERVSFYNKLENEFFDGDFSYLSNLLGTELDFDKVQNLLLGQAIFDLREDRYEMLQTDDNYQLTPKQPKDLFMVLFRIEPRNFKMTTQQLSQPRNKRLLEIAYKDYQKINKWIVPNSVLITAIDKDVKNTIDIEFRNIEFDQQLTFPYKIPDGYKEIVLKKDDI